MKIKLNIAFYTVASILMVTPVKVLSITEAELRQSCELDVELTEYVASKLIDMPYNGSSFSADHDAQIQGILNTHAGLEPKEQLKKVYEACGEGTILQGRYGGSL